MHQRYRRERGNSLVEFALVAAFLVPLLGGMFTIGSAMVRGQQVQQLNRDVGSMWVRNVPMTNTDSRRLVARLARGLDFGTPEPSATGSGIIYLSEIYRVAERDCAEGGYVPPFYPGCPLREYVFTRRIALGNTTLTRGRFARSGGPVGMNSEGRIAMADALGNPVNLVVSGSMKVNRTDTTGALHLEPGNSTRVAETYIQLNSLNILISLDSLAYVPGTLPGVYALNLY